MKNDNSNTAKKEKVPLFQSFLRSQATSAVSTIFDFGSSGLLYYVFHVHYGVSSYIGNIFGALVSFYMGRNWAFKSQDGKLSHQAGKYAITSFSSACINTVGILFLTENFGIDPAWSKVILAALVGVSFNFLMFRYFVYK